MTGKNTGQIELIIPMKLPEKLNGEERLSGAEVINTIKMTLTLKRGSKLLDVSYEVENASENHRLRLVVRTGIDSENTLALAPFDLSQRLRGEHFNPEIRNADEPNSGFIAIIGQAGTVGIFNRGLYEYEHMNRPGGQIALTLLRATGVISIRRGADKTKVGEDWTVPENQCVGNWQTRGEIGLYFESAGTAPELLASAFRSWRVPLLTRFASRDEKKLRCGRPVVQDSDIDEVFVRPDPYSEMTVNSGWSLLGVEAGIVDITAIKHAQKKNGIILRLYVPGKAGQEVVLRVDNRIYGAELLSLDEKTTLKSLSKRDGKIAFKLAGKKMATVFLKFEC